MDVSYRGPFFPGRLDTVLDRSWEVQPVTWSQLTWWDPMPCGQILMSHLHHDEFSLYLPSPAFSMHNNPPTPQKRRKMQPTQLDFQPASSSPIDVQNQLRRSSLLSNSSLVSNCSPLAWPLPPSPDSFTSVFLPNLSPDSTPGHFNYSANSPTKMKRSFTMVDSMLRRASSSILPTPPDSEDKKGVGHRSLSYKVFNFPMPPPTLPSSGVAVSSSGQPVAASGQTMVSSVQTIVSSGQSIVPGGQVTMSGGQAIVSNGQTMVSRPPPPMYR